MTEQRLRNAVPARPNIFNHDFNLRDTNPLPLSQRQALENMGIENEKREIKKQ